MVGLWNVKDLKSGVFPGVKRVTFEHYRLPEWEIWFSCVGKPADDSLYHYRKGVDGWLVSPRGGKTVCHLVLEDGRKFTGEAVCSLSDAFSYKKGRDLSFERALNAAGVDYIPF